ncbi:hypothetical protein CsatA_026413 [Cannabis sativa]
MPQIPYPGSGGGTVRGNQGEARQCYNVAMHLSVLVVHGGGEPRSMEQDELDPRVGSETAVEPMEDTEEVNVCDLDSTKVIRPRKYLELEERSKIIETLKVATNVFAWCQGDMTVIRPHVITHVLNITLDMLSVQRKRRPLDPVKADALEKVVDKMLTNGLIRNVYYSEWLANPVLVPKLNGTWRVCIAFTDPNKASPKDCFPLPRIDQMVDATSGFKLLSFMDAYSGYNQIKMHVADQEYNLAECFEVVWRYGMKLNPKKCIFGVKSGKFMGFIVSQRGIEANPKKIQALLNMPSPKKHKDVQSLTGKIAALSRFISQSTDKCILFFNILKKCQKFEWSEECEEAFKKLKEHMAKTPVLSEPVHGEDLLLYLVVFENDVSAALVREEDKTLLPGHPIKVLTNHPLWQVLKKPKASGRLLKWAMELSQFDIHYVPRISIKGQALADFITECNETEASSNTPTPRMSAWKVFVDGASNENGSRAVSPDGLRLQATLCFVFPAYNNEVEYEALIVGLRLAKVVGATRVEVFSDSKLVVNQVSGEYQTCGEKMVAYVAIVRELL